MFFCIVIGCGNVPHVSGSCGKPALHMVYYPRVVDD